MKNRCFILDYSGTAITCLGLNLEETWDGLVRGKSVFCRGTQAFPSVPIDSPVAACRLPWGTPLEERGKILTMLACKPLRPIIANLRSTARKSLRIGVLIATAHGEAGVVSAFASHEYQNQPLAADGIPDRLLEEKLYEAAFEGLGDIFAIQTVSAACASGLVATGIAFEKIRSGVADAYIVVSVDPLSRVAFAGFHQIGALSALGCKPFDLNRDGTTVGEAAAAFIVCNEKTAPSLDYPEILGFSHNCSAKHPVEPSIDGIAAAMRSAISFSGLYPRDLIGVIWHGTGTIQNDLAEATAAQQVFGDDVPPSTSIKGSVGHTMGSASAISLLAACRAIRTKLLPPSNTEELEYPWLRLVTGEAQNVERGPILINGLGFGGINSTMILAPGM